MNYTKIGNTLYCVLSCKYIMDTTSVYNYHINESGEIIVDHFIGSVDDVDTICIHPLKAYARHLRAKELQLQILKAKEEYSKQESILKSMEKDIQGMQKALSELQS